MSGMALKREVIRVINVKGNNFYNLIKTNQDCITFDLETKDIIENYSLYSKN